MKYVSQPGSAHLRRSSSRTVDHLPRYVPVVRVADADARLREMLTAAGVELQSATSAVTARTVWETYKSFAAEPVDEALDDPDADMVIFAHGISEAGSGGRVFILVLTRQFSLCDSRGEHDHMEQLQCSVWCDLTPELERIGFEEGMFLPTATHLGEWITDVEKSPGFAALLQEPIHVGVQQEHV
jgi:hypothetical protein